MRQAAVILALLSAPALAGSPVTPNAGAMRGQGSLSDNNGNSGTWQIVAVLKDGDFTGTGRATIGGVVVEGPLTRGGSYLENGKCYFKFEQGRNRVEIGGPCTLTTIEGRLGGFVAGDLRTGTMRGTLSFGTAARAAAPGKGVLPMGKLTCAWMERIGGNVAGDLPRYDLRMSNMVTLTLTADGQYRTNKAMGKFVRDGDSIRLTTGAFAGARGRLTPDRSGVPAVYFEIAENRSANGVHIVDPARTACTKAR